MAQTDTFLQFTAEEREIIAHAQRAEEFRHTAWEEYGEDWTAYIPTNINAFIWYYFRTRLFRWHLAMYYAPVEITEITVHGGRGSAKTVGGVLTEGAFHALHPGEDCMFLAPTLDQARRSFQELVTLGGQADGQRPTFNERFVARINSAPFPEIHLNRWGAADPGTKLIWRSVGQDDQMEKLRSHTVGSILFDEAFRDVPNGDVIFPQLRGCIRGLNTFYMNLLPKAVRTELDNLLNELSLTASDRRRKTLEAKLNLLIAKHRLSKRSLFLALGNAGPHDWEWERHAMGQIDRQHYLSMTVTSRDNPYFTQEQRDALERSFGENLELRDVEMLGRRPMSLGTLFAARNLDAALNEDLALVKAQAEAGAPGYVFGEHLDFGCFQFQMPEIAGHRYVVGADPGAGLAPRRNKWVVMVADANARPVRLVYFEMGYLHTRQAGDFLAFWQRMKFIREYYHVETGDMWIDSTGTQKGMTQLAFPEDLAVTPVAFNSKKLELINMAAQLFARRVLSMPLIPTLRQELGNYDLPDDKLTQDCVMAMICLAGAVWRYVESDYQLRSNEPEDALTLRQGLNRYLRPKIVGGRNR